MPSLVSSPVDWPASRPAVGAGGVNGGSRQRQRQAAKRGEAARHARRHSWTHCAVKDSRAWEWQEEKEGADCAEAGGSECEAGDGRGEGSTAARVVKRTSFRRLRTRHTIGDSTELRAAQPHFRAAEAQAAVAARQAWHDDEREEEEEKEEEEEGSRAGSNGVVEQGDERLQQYALPMWRTRQPPELPTLHLFPPSPASSEASSEAVPLTAAAATDIAATTGGEEVASDAASRSRSSSTLDLSLAADSLLASAGSSFSSAAYRAAVPHTTLSFSAASESEVAPDRALRYRHTEAAIAAHHAEQQRQAAAVPDGEDGATDTAATAASCCLAGPCFARCADDAELLQAWRELLDGDGDAAGQWCGEEELLAAEASFQSAARKLVWRGIPHSIRQRAWLRLLRDKMPSRDMDAYYALMAARVQRAQQQHDEQQRKQQAEGGGGDGSFGASVGSSPLWSSFADIEKDVNRTLPTLWLFRSADGVERLRRVLLAYCVHCPLVGYCQGLNFIAGSLLLVCEGDEVCAFSLLAAMVDCHSGYYSRSMAACMVDTAVLSDLCGYYEPELCALLSSHGLSLSNFCSSWLICLFCNTPLSVYDTFRVWDVMHALGDEALFRCALSLLRHAHARIAATRSSEELMLLFLQQLGDVQRIEPVLQHMHAEWLAEPLLAHSIAALREYHRYEVTAEHSTLPAATLVRLSEKLSFSEDELQRLWQLFIRPDPWLTISTQCIQSLVHFRYSFCAAVFHPDASAHFRGRGLILPFHSGGQSEAATSAQSIDSSAPQQPPLAASASALSSSAPSLLPPKRPQLSESSLAANGLSAANCAAPATLAAPRAAVPLSNTLSDAPTQPHPAIQSPDGCNSETVRADSPAEGRLRLSADPNPTAATTRTAGAATTPTTGHSAYPTATLSVGSSSTPHSVSPLCSLSVPSSLSLRVAAPSLSQLSGAVVGSGGAVLRSLASTFVIPAADEQSDSIFAHANSRDGSSRQASYQRAKSQPNQQTHNQRLAARQHQTQTQAHHSTQRVQPGQALEQQSLSSRPALDSDYSLFHAPSTSVPLASPPMSPSSRSTRLSAAARVFAFAFSPNSASSLSHTTHAGGTGAAGSGSRRKTSSPATSHPLQAGMQPPPLPSSFSAHRALLSATANLSSTPSVPSAARASDYGRLTVRRPSLSATLSLPAGSPMSAPYALYSATASPLQLPDSAHSPQPFRATTPLALTRRYADSSGKRHTGGDSASSSRIDSSVPDSGGESDPLELPAPPCPTDTAAASPAATPTAPLAPSLRCARSDSSVSSPPPSVPASVGVLGVSGVGGVLGAGSVYACSDNVLARLFCMLDGSSRGVVDFDEFCFGVCLFKRYPLSARLRAIFQMCDVAGEGQVSRADFTAFVAMFERLYHGKRASEAELQAFVAAAFDRAAPSQFINCPLFERIAPLHAPIRHFFRLDTASD